MLFNSASFALFFLVVYFFYLGLGHRGQNRLLLAASLFFYGAWDWRFLFLLFASTLIDYFCALRIAESSSLRRRRLFLWASVAGNLSILGFFKYFNFFAANFQRFLALFGIPVEPVFLRVILPVGISFYTFQALSYTIDVYRGRLSPTRSLADFLLYVTFFPQLVAGPIERAGHLLPQVLSPRVLTREKFSEGAFLFFWGLFQKVFIADNLGRIVDPVFAAAPSNGARVLLAVYAFTVQIYCDFAGYSNMARGLGRWLGFDIRVNFNLPFFSTNPRELWRRWHISLAEWMRDYVYRPLGGAKKKTRLRESMNLLITMALVGLWHGAAWTFVAFGLYHGALLVLHRLIEPWMERIHPPLPPPAKAVWFLAKVVFFFHCLCFGFLLFRAGSMTQVFQMAEAVFHRFAPTAGVRQDAAYFLYFTFFLWIVEIFQWRRKNLLAPLGWNVYAKTAITLAAVYWMFYVGLLARVAEIGGGNAFIYYQF